jgi:hypothetical protein
MQQQYELVITHQECKKESDTNAVTRSIKYNDRLAEKKSHKQQEG